MKTPHEYAMELLKPEATPTPPAQGSNPWQEAVLNECMVIEGCYVEADPVKTVRCLIDWHVQNATETPAQEDEPVYWLLKSTDQDDPFLVDNKSTLDLYLNAGLTLEAKLYTRPAADKLRQAAEEVLSELDGLSAWPQLKQLTAKLRAALESKPTPLDTDKPYHD